jgi:hypothetical protein
MASPTFYLDGHTPNQADGNLRVLQKILGSINDGGGGGGGGTVCITFATTPPVAAPDLTKCDVNIVFGDGAIAGNLYVYLTSIAVPQWVQLLG